MDVATAARNAKYTPFDQLAGTIERAMMALDMLQRTATRFSVETKHGDVQRVFHDIENAIGKNLQQAITQYAAENNELKTQIEELVAENKHLVARKREAQQDSARLASDLAFTKKASPFQIEIHSAALGGSNMTKEIAVSAFKLVDWEAYTAECVCTKPAGRDDFAHGVVGISTEAGELLDVLKRRDYYDKNVDRANVIEELGDLCWYMALVMSSVKATMVEVLNVNAAKLRTRYTDGKFAQAAALDRDLEAERRAIETGKEQ